MLISLHISFAFYWRKQTNAASKKLQIGIRMIVRLIEERKNKENRNQSWSNFGISLSFLFGNGKSANRNSGISELWNLILRKMETKSCFTKIWFVWRNNDCKRTNNPISEYRETLRVQKSAIESFRLIPMYLAIHQIQVINWFQWKIKYVNM